MSLRNWLTGPLRARLGAAPDAQRWIVLDVETSGLNLHSDRLLAIAAVAVEVSSDFRRISIIIGDSYEAVLKQDLPSHKDNILIHHIGAQAQSDGRLPVVVLEEFEFNLLQYALSYRFIDRIKLRFKERYLDMCRDNKDLLSPYFQISRDKEAEEYVFTKVGEKVELYYLVARDVKKEVTEVPLTDDFEKIVYSNLPQIFEDDNIYRIFKSTDFLFYMRNIYKSNEYLKNVWSKLYYFFNDVHYIDREINSED